MEHGYECPKVKRNWTYTLDGQSRCGYIQIIDAPVSETIQINENINLDIGPDGELVGIEIL